MNHFAKRISIPNSGSKKRDLKIPFQKGIGIENKGC
jgi:hypothetical protein